jgi:hypothetical protein
VFSLLRERPLSATSNCGADSMMKGSQRPASR